MLTRKSARRAKQQPAPCVRAGRRAAPPHRTERAPTRVHGTFSLNAQTPRDDLHSTRTVVRDAESSNVNNEKGPFLVTSDRSLGTVCKSHRFRLRFVRDLLVELLLQRLQKLAAVDDVVGQPDVESVLSGHVVQEDRPGEQAEPWR